MKSTNWNVQHSKKLFLRIQRRERNQRKVNLYRSVHKMAKCKLLWFTFYFCLLRTPDIQAASCICHMLKVCYERCWSPSHGDAKSDGRKDYWPYHELHECMKAKQIRVQPKYIPCRPFSRTICTLYLIMSKIIIYKRVIHRAPVFQRLDSGIIG